MDELTDIDLDEVLRSASEHTTVGERATVVSSAAWLRTRVAGAGDPLVDVVAALEYYPVEGCEHVLLEPAARPASCACAASLVPSDPGVLALWARALAHAPHPLVGARFADLLWTAAYGDTPHEWAQRAVDAYLAAVYDDFGHVVEVMEGLQRALRLTGEIDDHPRQAAVLAALVGLAERSLAADERSSGVTLTIIATLADQPPESQPPELEGLLERALDRYRDDPWLLESVLDSKARVAEPAERERLHLEQIDAFVQLARRSDGSLRHAHYEHAVALAVRHRLPTLAEQLRAELADPGAVPAEPDPIVVETDAAETGVAGADRREPQEGPPGQVDDFIGRIVGDDSMGGALARFGASLATEGHSDPVEPAEMDRLAYFGVLAVDLLARIRSRYGPVSAAAPWFECALIGPTIASRIAHGIELYEQGDVDAAASVLAPRLEWIVRAVASAAGITEVGSEQGINEVLGALAGTLYEPSRRYLRALLPCTAESATAQDAALLVHAACHLRLLQPVEVVREAEAVAAAER